MLSMFQHLSISLALGFFLQVLVHHPAWSCWQGHSGAAPTSAGAGGNFGKEGAEAMASPGRGSSRV